MKLGTEDCANLYTVKCEPEDTDCAVVSAGLQDRLTLKKNFDTETKLLTDTTAELYPWVTLSELRLTAWTGYRSF